MAEALVALLEVSDTTQHSRRKHRPVFYSDGMRAIKGEKGVKKNKTYSYD